MPKFPSFSSADFVKAWQESKTIEEVAQKLQITRKQATWTACNYRRRGLMLKYYSRGIRYHRDWSALQRLAHQSAACFLFLIALSVLPLSASALEIKLTWIDNSNNEDGFTIARKLGAEPYKEIGKVGANVKEFIDTSAQLGQIHTYRVLAFNAQGSSSPSNEATILYTSTWPIDFQSSTVGYDVAAIITTLSKPQTATTATLTLRLHDGDTAKEGELIINGNGPIIFPAEANSALSNQEANFTFPTKFEWWQNGENKLTFRRNKGKNFKVISASVVFTVPLMAPSALSATAP